MKERAYRVGELARLTGISVRALHHYDSIGLLCPSEREANGYRLYEAADVARLQQIQSLRGIGFSLAEVQQTLECGVFLPDQIIELHIARLESQIALQIQLGERLRAVQQHTSSRRDVSVEELLKIIAVTTMTEKYYTPQQREFLQQRAEVVGAKRIREVEAAWPQLMDEVRAAIERGDDPSNDSSRELARRWQELVEEFTGGDAGICDSLDEMVRSETEVAGMDVAAMQPLFEFIGRARETD